MSRNSIVVTICVGIATSMISGIIVIFALDGGDKLIVPGMTLVVNITILVMLFMILYFTEKNLGKTNETKEEIKAIINAQGEGFRQLSITDATRLSTEKTSKSTRIRVIGMGRQDQEEIKSLDSKLIQDYLRKIEQRLSKSSDDGFNLMTYQRIAPRRMTEAFQEHIQKCFRLSATNNNEYKIVLFDDFSATHTYIIFDSNCVILQLQNPIGANRKDAALNFVSYDPNIVQKYSYHFDHLWGEHYHVGLLHKFRDEVEKITPLVNELSIIRKCIDEIPYVSIGVEHARLELAQTSARIAGLSESKLAINHKIANGNLINIFSLYIKSLKKGDKYSTISFYEFWKDIDKDNVNFFKANEEALENGAIIKRTVAVNDEFIMEVFKEKNRGGRLPKMYDKIKEKVKLNSSLLTKGEYHIEFLFLDRNSYLEYRKIFYNFALIEISEQECTLLFTPDDIVGRFHAEKGSTSLYFIYEPPLMDSKRIKRNEQNKRILEDYKVWTNEVEDKLEMQRAIKKDHREWFLKDIGVNN